MVLIVASFLITSTIKGKDILAGTAYKTACQHWVDLRAKQIAGAQLFGGEESPCVTKINNWKEDSEEDLYKIIAEEMYDCWSMYREGQRDFYSDWDWDIIGDTHCRVCSENIFKNYNGKIDIKYFQKYLNENSPPLHKETYAEYFSGESGTLLDFWDGELNVGEDFPLYTFFVVTKGESPSFLEEAKEQVGRTTIFGIIGGVIGGVSGGLIGFSAFGIGAIPGAVGGAKLGFYFGVSTAQIVELGETSYFYPGMFIVNNQNLKQVGCDKVYYNPTGKEDTGFEGLNELAENE